MKFTLSVAKEMLFAPLCILLKIPREQLFLKILLVLPFHDDKVEHHSMAFSFILIWCTMVAYQAKIYSFDKCGR